MRRILVLPLILLILGLAAAGCGGSSETTTVQGPFPPIHVKHGQAYAKAPTEAKAGTYCFYMVASWPKVYAGYDKVIFQVPGAPNDYVCKRSR